MNILVLNYEYPPLGGGAAPVSRELSQQLAKRGHQVDVVTMGFGDLSAFSYENGVSIYRLKCIRTHKSSCKPWEQYSYLLALRFFMRKHMKTHHYDVCHCHFVIPTGEAAKWVSKKYDIPYVVTAHGSDVEGHNSKKSMVIMHRFLRPFWKQIVGNSYAVASPSVYLENLMRNNYPTGNYVFIPNGIEYHKYSDNTFKENKKKTILVMGRLQSFKNVQMIIDAFSKIPKELLIDWKMEIVGDGPYREFLEKRVSDIGLKEFVSFTGWIDNNTPEHLQHIYDASIYISASRFENCPMSVIEAAAAKCCLLLSDIPAHRQLISDDECFFNIDDVGELANKLEKLLDDGANVKPISVEAYDWSQIILKYEHLLYKASKP